MNLKQIKLILSVFDSVHDIDDAVSSYVGLKYDSSYTAIVNVQDVISYCLF